MAIEVEKKFRLTAKQFAAVEERLKHLGGTYEGRRFETNILYSSEDLLREGAFVRLRKLDETTVLTFKKKLSVIGGIKSQLEFETEVTDFEEVSKIIEHLGLRLDVVYEKKRAVWRLDQVEIVLDELPFGLFMEIEGTGDAISAAETRVRTKDLVVELETYPTLVRKFGDLNEGVSQSVFDV